MNQWVICISALEFVMLVQLREVLLDRNQYAKEWAVSLCKCFFDNIRVLIRMILKRGTMILISREKVVWYDSFLIF